MPRIQGSRLVPMSSLSGQLLVSMPNIDDERFERSVIYLCSHDEEHAMGMVINHPHPSMTVPDMLDQLGIPRMDDLDPAPVVIGGPVETERGFVLHSLDYLTPDQTLRITDQIGMTPTRDVLEAIARPLDRPKHYLTVLGYAGWGPGQLETEIMHNVWLVCPARDDLLFSTAHADKWARALASIGISPATFTGEAGRA